MKASFYDMELAKVKVFIPVHAMKLWVGMMYILRLGTRWSSEWSASNPS